MSRENGKDGEVRLPLGQRLRGMAAYPVFYMFATTFFFTLILVGIARLTRARVEANRQIMFERAALMAVLPGEVNDGTPLARVHKLFTERIQPPDGTSGGAYRLMENDALKAYAVPMEGQGFWNVIRGVIGIAPDRKTVVGIAFHDQEETPGLGAEIVKPYFRERFKGIEMAEGDRPIGIRTMAASLEKNEVDAVTGATQTCTRLEKIVNEAVSGWRSAVGGEKGAAP